MKRSEQDLCDAATHADYEIQMLNAMASLLPSHRKTSATEQAIANACLESFVLHVRNLIDFLNPLAGARPDDIVAEHFVGDRAEWEKARSPKTHLLVDAETRVNKLAAHLTYSRIQLQKSWRFADIHSDLSKVLTRFYDQLATGRQAWFPNLR